MLRQLFRQLVRVWPLLLTIGLLMKVTMKAKSDKISENFDFSEFDAPDDAKVKANIKRLVENVLQPLRNALGLSIVITSGYRNPEKNQAVGGVKNSLHMTGQAADFVVQGASLSDVFNTIQALKLPFNELIFYREGARSASGHLHISYISEKENKKRVLITESNYKRK